MNPGTGVTTGNLSGIQHLRGYAALLVVLYHAYQMSGMGKYYGTHAFGQAFAEGFIGVDIFFCISGFIIHQTTARRRTAHAPLSPQDYLGKRLIRVLPFMWVMTVVYAVFRYLGTGQLDLVRLLDSLLLRPGADLQPNVLWTLRHELLFYLLFGLTLLSRPAGLALLGLWTVLPVPLMLAGHASSIDSNQPLYPLLGGANLLFAFGILGSALFEKVRDTPLRLPAATCGVIVVLIYLAAHHTGYSRSSPQAIIAVGMACTLLIVCAGFVPAGASLYSRLMDRLGDSSYAIYLSHSMLLSFGLGLFSRRLPWLSVNAGALLAVLLALGGGVLFYLGMERPLLARLRRAVATRSRAPAVVEG